MSRSGMMLGILGLVLLLASCDAVCNKAGDMRCKDNVSQLCNEDGYWEDFRDCASVGMNCYTEPSVCAGFVGVACCR